MKGEKKCMKNIEVLQKFADVNDFAWEWEDYIRLNYKS